MEPNSPLLLQPIRTHKACDYCRIRKIACKGGQPCGNCRQRQRRRPDTPPCTFSNFQRPRPKPRKPKESDAQAAFKTTFVAERLPADSVPPLSRSSSTPSSGRTSPAYQLNDSLTVSGGQVTLPEWMFKELCANAGVAADTLLQFLNRPTPDPEERGFQDEPVVPSESNVVLFSSNGSAVSTGPFSPDILKDIEEPALSLTDDSIALSPIIRSYAPLLRTERHRPIWVYPNPSTLQAVSIETPWLLLGTSVGSHIPRPPAAVPHRAPPNISINYPLFVTPPVPQVDLLFHSTIVCELLHRYCQRIYPVLGSLYYRRLIDRYERNAVPASLVCALMAYEAAYSDHPVVYSDPAYATGLIYQQRARVSVLENLEGSSLDDVFTLFLMGDNEMAFGNWDAGDFYFSAALRLGQRLGLHLTDAPGPVRPIGLNGNVPILAGIDEDTYQESKRVVWWIVYMFQLGASLILGTSPTVNPVECRVKLPNQRIRLVEYNRQLLSQTDYTAPPPRDHTHTSFSVPRATHSAPAALHYLPSILPEYTDMYQWLPDDRVVLNALYTTCELIQQRKLGNWEQWIHKRPYLNHQLDNWLLNFNHQKYAEYFPGLSRPQAREEHVLKGALLMRLTEIYTIRIRLNDTSGLLSPGFDNVGEEKAMEKSERMTSISASAEATARLDKKTRTECRDICWITAWAVGALIHRAKFVPMPCHNLSVAGCLYLTGMVCLVEIEKDDSPVSPIPVPAHHPPFLPAEEIPSNPPSTRAQKARILLKVILDFLRVHAIYYPFNNNIIGWLRRHAADLNVTWVDDPTEDVGKEV
ncbi:hypothetical protein H4R33_002810 [Dimargaris cristalligena]|nr:hypothetical protein H4R33_002810 [Dimargaris cristalligena]